jgi:ribonuclease P protein component
MPCESETQLTQKAAPTGPRIGYTVTKRIGNSVIRNRVKRRLRAALAELGPNELQGNCDYVLIARPGALKRAFAELTNDLRKGLANIHRSKNRSQSTKRG